MCVCVTCVYAHMCVCVTCVYVSHVGMCQMFVCVTPVHRVCVCVYVSHEFYIVGQGGRNLKVVRKGGKEQGNECVCVCVCVCVGVQFDTCA